MDGTPPLRQSDFAPTKSFGYRPAQKFRPSVQCTASSSLNDSAGFYSITYYGEVVNTQQHATEILHSVLVVAMRVYSVALRV